MADAEHIFLESDESVVPTLETARRIHARLVLHGSLWRRSIELALIDHIYLSVRTARAKSVDARYVVDLRFVDPAPRLKRRLAWSLIAASVAFFALGIFGARSVAASTVPWWRHEWLAATAVLFSLAGGALFAAIRLTTETLTLVSAHGRAKLVAHTGGLGTFRTLHQFLPRLQAHLRIAVGARHGTRAEQLRDEMREHFRLRNAGALTEAEYESAKRRILAMHDPSAARATIARLATSRRASGG
jgi:hypothetical protein